jgi:hypothetical protein
MMENIDTGGMGTAETIYELVTTLPTETYQWEF